MTRIVLKANELLAPLLGEADPVGDLLEGLFDEFFELVFILNDDRCHRPLEVVPDLLDWIKMRRARWEKNEVNS